jgi:hypothetical protein
MFHLGVYNDAVTNFDCTESNDWMIKQRIAKDAKLVIRSNLRDYPSMCLDER